MGYFNQFGNSDGQVERSNQKTNVLSVSEIMTDVKASIIRILVNVADDGWLAGWLGVGWLVPAWFRPKP